MISCEGYDVQALFKHPIRLILNSCFLFSQWPWDGQNLPKLGVSVGCLKGVWEVSGGCLGDSGYYVGGMMFKKQINIQSDSFALAYSFFHSCFGLVEICHILGCLRVSGGCLDGVWGVSEASWILPGWY